ncbi:MAG TPA: isoprenylcysteine carboxylmethyltransferase family protein [Gammaproteobacteria bacterium]|jgi:protein-S-isoprenylcysteine O-methyltransferase Ste14
MERKRKILPPVYLLLTLALMTGFHFLAPIAVFIPAPVSYAGAVLVVLGITVASIAAWSFHKAGTPVIPFEPSTALVTGGLYKYTRNPMYLGMLLLLIGIAVLFGSLGPWLPIPFFIWVIQANFICGEERFLESIFGERYLEYKRKVRRWL